MRTENPPINESIREISNCSWLIADKLVLLRQPSPPSDQPSWSDGKDSFYVLSEVPGALPESIPLSDTSGIKKVYDAGGVSAVWRVGEAFIKVKKVALPNATREHVTLDYLRANRSLNFDIPDVHYHGEFDGRYYIVLSRVPGPTLAEVWPGLDDTARQNYAHRVAITCQELATWKSNAISGVDGRELPDTFLNKLKAEKNCDPQHLLNNCRELGMDCSSFVFYHCDLGPGNIIANQDSVGIIDWETAGFVPVEWIRTKFCISSGMDLPVGDEDARSDWRRLVSRQLGRLGFVEIADEWLEWWTA
ncbi:kinase-like protein [Durotheca rogersii]|uniref:kinase-like protein n=1 Tax=Durotheca rogersii TaxID=419775 RepID=UPI00221F6930|nr:kinase-like protein [Durotheca rogersii]KAI5865297.1 kinase-like protein [Durotheca rogersii]